MHRLGVVHHRVQHAAAFGKQIAAFFQRNFARAKKAVEQSDGAGFPGNRIARIRPRKRKPRTVAGIVLAFLLPSERQAGEPRFAAQNAGGELIDRNRVLEFFARRRGNVSTRHPRRRAPVTLRRVFVREVAENGEILAMPLHVFERGGQLIVHPGRDGKLVIFGDAPGITEENQPLWRRHRDRGACRAHAFERWQANRGSKSAKDSAAGGGMGVDHGQV